MDSGLRRALRRPQNDALRIGESDVMYANDVIYAGYVIYAS
jgi:hypothetical protein